jgi:hypothetical protein
VLRYSLILKWIKENIFLINLHTIPHNDRAKTVFSTFFPPLLKIKDRNTLFICSRILRTSDWGEGSPSNRKMTLSIQPRQCRSGFLEWPSQSPDLNLIKHLWRDLKIAVQQCSPSNLIQLERIGREEWEKLPEYRCAELLASYPRRLDAVIAKGASTKC